MIQEMVKLNGRIHFELRDRKGYLKETRDVSNLIVTVGKAGVSARIGDVGAFPAFGYIAIGIGIIAPAAGDTILGSEITTGGGERGAGTNTQITTTTTNDTLQSVKTFNFTATFAVTESGLLNAVSAGTLLCRQTFAAINVVSGDSLQVTWKVQVT